MNNNELIISQIRQRLEILYQLVEKLEEEGGGGGGEGGTTNYLDLTNKPSIGGVALVGNRTIDQLGGVLAGTLARVATSGSYNDLSDKPTIPAAQVPADWNATSGVTQILNKPTIPAAQVNSDWNATSGVARILNRPTLSAVATSGSYNDLSNKPTIDSSLSTTSTNAVQNKAITAQIQELIKDKADIPQIVSTEITDTAAEDYSDGTIIGYASSIAGFAGAWVIVRTYTLNAGGTRKVQIVETNNGNRKTRFYNGTWNLWTPDKDLVTGTATSTTSLAATPIEFTCKAGGWYRLTALLRFNAAPPTAVAIKRGNSTIAYNTAPTGIGGISGITASGVDYFSANTTVTVWGQWSSSEAGCSVALFAERIDQG